MLDERAYSRKQEHCYYSIMGIYKSTLPDYCCRTEAQVLEPRKRWMTPASSKGATNLLRTFQVDRVQACSDALVSEADKKEL